MFVGRIIDWCDYKTEKFKGKLSLKKLIKLNEKNFTLIYFLISIYSYSQVAVKGYYRKNGTYVQPHVRTAPNSTITDNYSYRGNYNPNTEYTKSSSLSSSPATYNYYNNSSSTSNYNKEWVNGYYRTDGTYVSGYYRKKRSTTTSSHNTSYGYSNNLSDRSIKNMLIQLM